MREDEIVKADLKTADELLSNMSATSKLHDALSATAVNRACVDLAEGGTDSEQGQILPLKCSLSKD